MRTTMAYTATLLIALCLGWQRAKMNHLNSPPKSWYGSTEDLEVFLACESAVSVGDFVDAQIRRDDGSWATIAFGARIDRLLPNQANLRIQTVDLSCLESLSDIPVKLVPTTFPGHTIPCEDCRSLKAHDDLTAFGFYSNAPPGILEIAPLHHGCAKCRSTLAYTREFGLQRIEELDAFIENKLEKMKLPD